MFRRAISRNVLWIKELYKPADGLTKHKSDMIPLLGILTHGEYILGGRRLLKSALSEILSPRKSFLSRLFRSSRICEPLSFHLSRAVRSLYPLPPSQ